jgi:hypothetical protein
MFENRLSLRISLRAASETGPTLSSVSAHFGLQIARTWRLRALISPFRAPFWSRSWLPLFPVIEG